MSDNTKLFDCAESNDYNIFKKHEMHGFGRIVIVIYTHCFTDYQVMGGLLGIPHYSKLEAILLLFAFIGLILPWTYGAISPVCRS